MIVQTLFIIAGAVLLISLLPWKVSLNGNIVLKGTVISTCGAVKLGTKRFGILVIPPKSIHFGPFHNPWFSFSRKKKAAKRKPMKKTKSKRTSSIKFLRPAFRAMHWDQFALTGKLGFKSPADTGIVYGGIQAVRGWVPSNRIQLDIQPVFTHQQDTDLTGSIRFRLVPAVLAWNLTKTYFNFGAQKG